MDSVLSFLKAAAGWILGVAGLLLVIGILYLLGKTGALIRKGMETKKFLQEAKIKASSQGLLLTEKWHVYNRKAKVWIIIPIISWVCFYVFVYKIFQTKIFLLSFLLLIVPILGFFGIFFVPSEEADDYF